MKIQAHNKNSLRASIVFIYFIENLRDKQMSMEQVLYILISLGILSYIYLKQILKTAVILNNCMYLFLTEYNAVLSEMVTFTCLILESGTQT